MDQRVFGEITKLCDRYIERRTFVDYAGVELDCYWSADDLTEEARGGVVFCWLGASVLHDGNLRSWEVQMVMN